MGYCFQNTFSGVTPKPDYGPFRSKDPGQDLSGSLQGAGGVGGLLMAQLNNPATSNQTTVFYCMDGNGNVMNLVDADDGSIAATYEYSPFGECIQATGPAAAGNYFRFSTKYFDSETGLGDWGRRYYHSETGRWLSRDPIEERGGLNLYGFVGNDAVGRWDYLGWDDLSVVLEPGDWRSDRSQALKNGTASAKWVDTGDTPTTTDSAGRLRIGVMNIAHGNRVLNSLGKKTGDCCENQIAELSILGHGWGAIAGEKDAETTYAHQIIGPFLDSPLPAHSAVNKWLSSRYGSRSERDISAVVGADGVTTYAGVDQLFTGVCFKPQCTIRLLGCKVGYGPAGKALLAYIAKVTKCKAEAYPVEMASAGSGALPVPEVPGTPPVTQ